MRLWMNCEERFFVSQQGAGQTHEVVPTSGYHGVLRQSGKRQIAFIIFPLTRPDL